MLELTLRVGLSLAVVLGLFWFVARIGSRKYAGATRSLVNVRGRRSLSRTASVAVVEVGSRLLVVGVSEGGVRLLTELDPSEVEDLTVGDATAAGGSTSPAVALPVLGALSGSMLSPQTWKQAWGAAVGRAPGADPHEQSALTDEDAHV